jgi:hypothetical protein
MEMPLVPILDKPNEYFHRPSVFQFLTVKSDDRQLPENLNGDEI